MLPTAEVIKPRKKRVQTEKTFVIESETGTMIVPEEELKSVAGLKGASIFLVGKKVASVEMIPGKINLLTGVKEDDKLDISYE